jgi:glycosyltransferase involved in cell wall biosynthesis
MVGPNDRSANEISPRTVCLVGREEKAVTGVGRYVDRLDAGLRERGVDVVRLSTHPRGVRSRVLDAARYAGADLNTFLSRYPVRLAWPRADVYHLTAHTYAGALMLSRPPGPTVVTVHDIGPFLMRDSKELSGYGHPIHRWLDAGAIGALAKADQIITVSEWTKQTLIESAGIGDDRITVTPLGVDHDKFRPFRVPREFRERYGLPDDRRFLVYVGNEEPRKNLETVWRALPHIRAVIPDAILLKVGPSAATSGRSPIVRLAHDLGVDDGIRFLDYVPEVDLPTFYNLADVVLVPSLYEGFGLPALEAMACARPLVVSDAPALIEVAGASATAVEPRDAQALAAAVIRLLSDPAGAMELADTGRKRAMEFGWSMTVARTLDVYRRVQESTDRS